MPELSAEELNLRARVNQVAHDAGDLIDDFMDRIEELKELGVSQTDVTVLLRGNLTKEHIIVFDDFCENIVLNRADETPGARLRKVIDRLFAEAPKMTDGKGKEAEGQAPAVECFVMLRAHPAPLHGVLSVTAEGTLRMMTPSTVQREPNKPPVPIMCEQFFEYEDVLSVMMEREMKVTAGSRIFTSS